MFQNAGVMFCCAASPKPFDIFVYEERALRSVVFVCNGTLPTNFIYRVIEDAEVTIIMAIPYW